MRSDMILTVLEANAFESVLQRHSNECGGRVPEYGVRRHVVMEVRLARRKDQALSKQVAASFPIGIEIGDPRPGLSRNDLDFVLPYPKKISSDEFGRNEQQRVEAEVSTSHEYQGPKDIYVLDQIDEEYCGRVRRHWLNRQILKENGRGELSEMRNRQGPNSSLIRR